MGISAVIIALNEEKNIADCLDSVSWADELIVIDSGSTDKTADIAREKGAAVYPRNFDNFMAQRNFAIEKASEDWIFFIDADERATEKLAAQIREAIKSDRGRGYNVPRRNFIFGKEMKYGGHQGDNHLRLFMRDSVHYVNPIHEKAVVAGRVADLEGELLHYSTATVEEYRNKLRLYTDLEAEYLKDAVESGQENAPWHYVYTKPVGKFLKQYFVQAGFLDGVKGLQFYALSAYNVFLKYRKYFDLMEGEKEGGKK